MPVCDVSQGVGWADVGGEQQRLGDSRSPMPNGAHMIIIGVILLIIGFVTGIAVIWTIGIIALVVGLVLALLGAVGHAVGGRRHYW